MTLLGKIPTVWDETIVLEARFGEYIVEARRSGHDWYLAAMNDWTPKKFTVSLGFLNEGNYTTETASDGINAAKNPQDYLLKISEVTQKDSMIVNLAPGGGFLARMSKK